MVAGVRKGLWDELISDINFNIFLATLLEKAIWKMILRPHKRGLVKRRGEGKTVAGCYSFRNQKRNCSIVRSSHKLWEKSNFLD